MIKKCTCRESRNGNTKAVEYQDRRYGWGNRVFNACAKSDPQSYRCTICGTTSTKKQTRISPHYYTYCYIHSV